MQRNPRKKHAIAFLIVIILIGSSLGSFLYISTTRNDKITPETVKIGLLPHEIEGLIYVAADRGYFADNGLNVTIRNYTSGLAAVNGMMNGEVDIATAADYVLVGRVLANKSAVAIGNIDKFSSEYLVGRIDLGVANVSDLKGKRIGVPMGTVAEFNLGRFLEVAGINMDQVTLVNVPIYLTPTALKNGSVDAVMTWQPNFNTIKGLMPNNTIAWPAQNDRLINYLAITNQSWALGHPDLVVKFLKALDRAVDFVRNDPGVSKNIVQNRLNYTDSYTSQVWPENQFSLSLDQPLILALEDQARWMKRNGLTQKEVPNFLNYIYLDGLESVEPGSVSVIR
jgi:NitT/TauT family transport system substrate-binding protein